MTDHSFAVQAAIFAALTTMPAVVGGRVYDGSAPENAVSPYIEIGATQAIPDDTSGGDEGISEFLDLHVWDRPSGDTGHRGAMRTKATIADIRDRLHGRSLTVEGRTSAFAWVRTVRTLVDQDGLTQHGIVTIEIIHRS